MSTKNKTNQSLIKISILVFAGALLFIGLKPHVSSYFEFVSQKLESFQEEARQESMTIVEANTANIEDINETIVVAEIEPPTKVITAQQPVATIPLPDLNESDEFLLKQIKRSDMKSLLVPIDIIRNMVVFTDNFARGELVNNFSPLEKPAEPFSVIKNQDLLIIDSKSYLRYDKYADAFSSIETEKFMELYTLFMPLIDAAYQEIGYPQDAFNGTFEKAIEHALETPVIYYKLEVNSPSVMYQYNDEYLEALPDTQKLLMRMGPDNLLMVKQKLIEIQSELQNY